MVVLISKKPTEEDPSVVILQLLDDSMYYVKHEEQLPRLEEVGGHHVEGELQVCPRDV
jgi:hypothetical protein